MKTRQEQKLIELTVEEIGCVAGAGPTGIGNQIPRAQDMYGNTLSHEEYMDRQLELALNGGRTLDGGKPHDFYEPGFNSDKPNIFNL